MLLVGILCHNYDNLHWLRSGGGRWLEWRDQVWDPPHAEGGLPPVRMRIMARTQAMGALSGLNTAAPEFSWDVPRMGGATLVLYGIYHGKLGSISQPPYNTNTEN